MKKYKDPSKSLSYNIEEYLLDNGITEKEVKLSHQMQALGRSL